MSRCAGWRTHGFTFLLMLLYHKSDWLLPHSILSHFFNHEFPGWKAQNCASIVLCPTNNTQSSAIYKLTAGLSHHALFRVTHFSLKSSETYNLTFGKSRLLGNHRHPSLKLVRPLSILAHFIEYLSRILKLAGSRNLQFLVTVYCARHLHTFFKVCNDQGLMLTVHHATIVQTVIKN